MDEMTQYIKAIHAGNIHLVKDLVASNPGWVNLSLFCP
jgi:hypothetical protein